MLVAFRQSFVKDLQKIHSRQVKLRIKDAIDEVERASNMLELTNLRKLRGHLNYYRIRVGDYRLGIVVDEDTVSFVRAPHRKEIYRHFP